MMNLGGSAEALYMNFSPKRLPSFKTAQARIQRAPESRQAVDLL
jgi:hypothetical protein